jgi:ribulose 1,5-bisphosphate synthetase/thiazole synthase
MNHNANDQGINKSYDCVVIGAGSGGLAAAAQLAVKGAKVLLLEQHNVQGGFATSFVRGLSLVPCRWRGICKPGVPQANSRG